VTAPPIVEAREVCRRYRSRGGDEVRALEAASLAVTRGALLAVTGPSGGGKSTLLALLGAIERPTSGRVLFDGQDLDVASGPALARVRRRIGFAFQGAPALRRLSAWENAAYPLVPRGIGGPERRERALALLARVGLAARAESRPEEMSAGEAQRLGLARALVGSPDLVLADEPTANLDRRSAEQVTAILREVNASGAAVVVATHDPLLLAAASRVLTLEAGRILAS
jgi:putative ABC transport system ATP-binding protein